MFWPTRAYERARAVLGTASVRGADRSAGDGQDRDRGDARARAADRRLGGASSATTPSRSGACSTATGARCSSPMTRSGRRSTARTRPSGGREGWAGCSRCSTPQHWLIWTSRPAPLKAGLRRVQRESGSERFPAPGEVLVDASDLDLADKTLILFRHAKDRGAAGTARRLRALRRVVDRRAPAFHAGADPAVRRRPARRAAAPRHRRRGRSCCG